MIWHNGNADGVDKSHTDTESGIYKLLAPEEGYAFNPVIDPKEWIRAIPSEFESLSHGFADIASEAAKGLGHAATHIDGDAFKGARHIGGDAFRGATHIGGDAFKGATHIGGDAFKGATHIGGDAFKGATHISGDAFKGASHLFEQAGRVDWGKYVPSAKTMNSIANGIGDVLSLVAGGKKHH